MSESRGGPICPIVILQFYVPAKNSPHLDILTEATCIV